MSILICGSNAMNHWLPLHKRKPNDTDYIGYYKDFDFNQYGGRESFTTTDEFIFTNTKLKIEFIDVTNCPSLEQIFLTNKNKTYLDLENLFLMKNAHKHFYLGKYKKSFKHLMDYSLLSDKDIYPSEEKMKLSEEYSQWLITNIYNNDNRLISFPNLDKSKQEFFDDPVKKYIDHDLIHEIVAIKKEPAYKQCLTGEVKFSNKKFNKLDYKVKANMVLEEAFVLAFERCLIPQFYGETYLPAFTPHEAFKYALTRIATNITSGPFRSFAALSFLDIYNIYLEKHQNYFKHINTLIGD